MARMTKAQKKRMVRDIQSKTKKLFTSTWMPGGVVSIISVADMAAIEKLTAKWMKRIG